MIKKSLKIISLLTLLAIPQNINEGYLPLTNRLENIKSTEIYEKKLKNNVEYDLTKINETIYSLERKKEFVLRRLNEEEIKDSVKNNYLNILNKTNESLNKYYSQKDSMYSSIKK